MLAAKFSIQNEFTFKRYDVMSSCGIVGGTWLLVHRPHDDDRQICEDGLKEYFKIPDNITIIKFKLSKEKPAGYSSHLPGLNILKCTIKDDYFWFNSNGSWYYDPDIPAWIVDLLQKKFPRGKTFYISLTFKDAS